MKERTQEKMRWMYDHVALNIGKNVLFEGAVETCILKPRMPFLSESYIGDGTWVQKGAVIYPGVIIGSNCLIGYNTVIRENTTIGNGTTIGAHSQVEGNVSIGSNCSIWTHAHLTAFTTIGDNVFIAPRFTGLNDPVMGYQRPVLHKDRVILGPTIGNNVRMSACVTVQPGITIGDEAVIGSCSLVTKDIPPAVVAFGSPAKVYRGVHPEHFWSKQ